jgi:hypothetical protein
MGGRKEGDDAAGLALLLPALRADFNAWPCGGGAGLSVATACGTPAVDGPLDPTGTVSKETEVRRALSPEVMPMLAAGEPCWDVVRAEGRAEVRLPEMPGLLREDLRALAGAIPTASDVSAACVDDLLADVGTRGEE